MVSKIISSLAIAALFFGASASPVATEAKKDKPKGQVPFYFPLADDGFPNIKVPSSQLTTLEKRAHGSLPNGALPTTLSDASAATFQVIAANEIFEVAYFTSLLNNITYGDYDAGKGTARKIVLSALEAVQAQEQLHALGANAVLASAKRPTVAPCAYKFPVSDFDSAIELAATFTEVVLGTLQAAELTFATTGDSALIPLVGSIIGQEGEQTGYYRNIGGMIPSSLPFLTRSSGIFAYSVINQMFIVPGSCPKSNPAPVPILEPLTVATMGISSKTTMVDYSFMMGSVEPSSLSLVYINQQNTPVVMELQNVKTVGKMVTFSAPFPYAANLLNGLTIVALTKTPGPFADADAVAADAVYGPGLIEV